MSAAATAIIPFGFCHCGCGQRTRLARQSSTKEQTIKGQPVRYVKNHQPKGSPRESHPGWIGGRRIARSGYVQIRLPEHPRACYGYVLEHILIVERAIGHYLDPKHQVHHNDENRSNNANTNLVACEDDAYHKLLHRRMRALLACGDPNAHPCEYCGGYDRQDEMHHGARPNGASRSYHPTCANEYNRLQRSLRLMRIAFSERESLERSA